MLIGLLWYVQNNDKSRDELESILITQMENAYAEGQSDAISGDVRIERVNDTTVVFVKGPWDNPNGDSKWEQWRGRHIPVQIR